MLVELMAVAVDASCTHLYTPGIRRHIQGAFAQGATIEEIMEVLKLCDVFGVDACELGTSILVEELANQDEVALQLPRIRAFWAPNSSSVRMPCCLSSARSFSCWIGSAAGGAAAGGGRGLRVGRLGLVVGVGPLLLPALGLAA